ncbi:MAG TPA: pyrroline-5-carboxylate reductase [Fibrobacteraceae bacterium]|nr:pyrroline-5-carboxylate reductase [Fibrobacteraceae bacterium]
MISLGNLLFLGTGNMGGAVLRGLLGKGVAPAARLAMVEPNDAMASGYTQQGVKRFSSAEEGFAWADLVLLCVKPHVFKTVAPEWRNALQKSGRRPEFISVMAGVTVESIRLALANSLTLDVLRCMPNLPMSIGKGMVALAGDQAPAELVEKGKAIFAPVANVAVVAESQLDAVTALSGSGPAWVFQFIEGLAQAGVMAGLTRDASMSMVLSTIEGSLALVRESGKSPADLTVAVSSPAGTTIYGLKALEASGFRSALMDAVMAAYERSKELGK